MLLFFIETTDSKLRITAVSLLCAPETLLGCKSLQSWCKKLQRRI